MSALVRRRDFVKRSRIDASCPASHGSLTVYCDVDDEPFTVFLFVEQHADCQAAS